MDSTNDSKGRGPKGYWIGRVDVIDLGQYQAYVRANAAVFAAYGARFLVRGGPAMSSSNFLRWPPHGTVGTRRAIRLRGGFVRRCP